MSAHVAQLLAWLEASPGCPPDRQALAEVLAAAGAPWQPCPPGGDYEAEVCAGRIPTRPGSWHDVFNAVAFARWPRTKAALHRRVLELRSRRVDRSRRSAIEDALTLLDEAALVLAVERSVRDAVAEARAHGDLDAIDRCVDAGAVHVIWLGHALVEHALHQRPPIGAGVVVLATHDAASADADLAAAIAADAFDRPRLGPNLPWPDVRVDRWLCASWAAAPLARRGRQMRP